MILEFFGHPHTPHDGQSSAHEGIVVDDGHFPVAFGQELRQFHADEPAADDHDVHTERHPLPRCLPHQSDIGTEPGDRGCLRDQTGAEASLAAERLRILAQHEPAEIVTREYRVEIGAGDRSEEHTSELQSLMRISYAVFCLKKKKIKNKKTK